MPYSLGIILFLVLVLAAPLWAAQCSNPWERTNCMRVVSAWFSYRVKFNSAPTTRQFVVNGTLARYYSDASGFVSAAWNCNAPGYKVKALPMSTLSSMADMQVCDAIVPTDPKAAPIADFISLFAGWDEQDNMVFYEECGQGKKCCGGNATCPGTCGTSPSSCNSYCDGCPLQRVVRSDLSLFKPMRRQGW